jgi:hypothetical protein
VCFFPFGDRACSNPRHIFSRYLKKIFQKVHIFLDSYFCKPPVSFYFCYSLECKKGFLWGTNKELRTQTRNAPCSVRKSFLYSIISMFIVHCTSGGEGGVGLNRIARSVYFLPFCTILGDLLCS